MQILSIHFLQPYFLYLIFLFPVFLFFYIKNEKYKSINLDLTIKEINFFNPFLLYIKFFIFFIVYLVFLIVLSDPNKIITEEKINKNGIDIVVAFDISRSMNLYDIEPSRIDKSKYLLKNFLSFQKTNRVGLVIFSGTPFAGIPLTFDYQVLIDTVNNISSDSLSGKFSGTAIGDALLLSKSLFYEKSLNREKAIILITDGDANIGADPKIVSDLLSKKNIKVYSVGIGDKNFSNVNFDDLLYISKNTGGYFFRASNSNTMENIFKKLEELERNDIEIETIKKIETYYSYFVYFLVFLIGFLCFIEFKIIKS